MTSAISPATTPTQYTFDTYEEWNLWMDLIEEADALEKHFPENAQAKYREAGEVLLQMRQQGIGADHFDPGLFAALCFEKNPETARNVADTFNDVQLGFLEYHREMVVPTHTIASKGETLITFLLSAPKYLEASFAALRLHRKSDFGDLLTEQVFWAVGILRDPALEDLEEAEYLQSYARALHATLEEILGTSHRDTVRAKEYLEELPQELHNTAYYEAILADLLAIYRAEPTTSVATMYSLFTDNHLPGP